MLYSRRHVEADSATGQERIDGLPVIMIIDDDPAVLNAVERDIARSSVAASRRQGQRWRDGVTDRTSAAAAE